MDAIIETVICEEMWHGELEVEMAKNEKRQGDLYFRQNQVMVRNEEMQKQQKASYTIVIITVSIINPPPLPVARALEICTWLRNKAAWSGQCTLRSSSSKPLASP